MNEVICSAEDNKIHVYYQDTDSIHLNYTDIDKLKTIYYDKYNRVLEGEELGQFHSDLKMEVIPTHLKSKPDDTAELKTEKARDLKVLSDGTYSTELIAIDKKTYLHILESELRGVKYNLGYMV